MNNTITADGNITLSSENLAAFKKAMKIGFYKSFLKKGIVNNSQFDKLMQIANEKN